MNKEPRRTSGNGASIIAASLLILIILLAYPVWALTINIVTRQVSAQVSQEVSAAVQQVNQSNQEVVAEIRRQVEAQNNKQEQRQALGELSPLQQLANPTPSTDAQPDTPASTEGARQQLLQRFLQRSQNQQNQPEE